MKEETEQLFNYYEYKRAYKISVERMRKTVNDVRTHINKALDTLESEVSGIMSSARCMEGGGVSMGKVWDLYPNNPEIVGKQSFKDHIKHLKNSKYPFEKILKILEEEE